MDLDFDSAAARGLRCYIRMVAVALDLDAESASVQLEPPVSAYLALADRLPLFPTRDVALVWDEEHGWAAGIETDSGEEVIMLCYLDSDVLPEPSVVAQFVRGLSGERLSGRPTPPAFRSAEDRDDLRIRLARYARVEIDQQPWTTRSA
jgi:Family of unknown function (DUF6292)